MATDLDDEREAVARGYKLAVEAAVTRPEALRRHARIGLVDVLSEDPEAGTSQVRKWNLSRTGDVVTVATESLEVLVYQFGPGR